MHLTHVYFINVFMMNTFLGLPKNHKDQTWPQSRNIPDLLIV